MNSKTTPTPRNPNTDESLLRSVQALARRRGIKGGVAGLVRLVMARSDAHYNRACQLALDRRPDAALCELSRAIELGWDDPFAMRTDPDLQNVKKLPAFENLLAQMRVKTRAA